MNSFEETEIALLNNTSFLLAKKRLSEKLFIELQNCRKTLELTFSSYPEFQRLLNFQSPKISKGENYKDLPYFVLDCPRYFTQASIFTFRTIIWWGHEISCSLLISGEILKHFKDALINNILTGVGFFCIYQNPWEYSFEEHNFISINNLNNETIINHIDRNGFVKIADKLKIDELNHINEFACSSLARFLMSLK